MRLLIFSDWFEPGYLAGGPIRSLQNLVARLGKDIEIDVLTSNTDFSSEKPYELKSNTWIERNGARVYYADKQSLNSGLIRRILKEEKYDKLYFNSLFSLNFTLLPLFIARRTGYNSAQIVLAPRGMLGEGALKLKSFKKKAFLFFAKLLGLFRGITWHSTSTDEMLQVQKQFGEKANIVKAENIPGSDITTHRKTKIGSKVSLVFLSRISQKKNLKFALECIARYSDPNRFRLDLYGTPEDNKYLEGLLRFAEEKQLDLKYHGAISHNRVAEVLSKGDFLLLPTLNENYGHVIFESLAVGTPVIISDQTPWRDLNSKGIGWDIPLKPTDWETALKEVLSLSKEDYAIMSQKSIDYAKEHLANVDLSAYFRLFQIDKS